MLKKTISFMILIAAWHLGHGQQERNEEAKMDWFNNAKLGIFVHWGIYSVDGISESWAFFNNYISHDNYLKQLNGFTAENYNPEYWAKLIKESGAKYTVVTSKHHDGIALWDSKAPEGLTTVKHSAAKRDVLTPFIKAVQAEGLKTGIYFSLPDWSHPYYDIKTRTQKRYAVNSYPKLWSKYVSFYQQQLEELSKLYKPDLLWFDGDWEHSSEEWKAEKSLALLRKYNPYIIINSRLNHLGDYETPEQGIPVSRPSSPYWELCYTMNDAWGYQPFDRNYKTPNMIIRTLVDCISMGGNLLLGIGPMADGTIPKEQVDILKELGRWTSKYAEAIYATRAGVDNRYVLEKNAFSKDGKTMFIYLDAVKYDMEITGLHSKPKNIRLLNSTDKVAFQYDGYKLTIDLENNDVDSVVSVLAVDFEDEPVFELRKVPAMPIVNQLLKGQDTHKVVQKLAYWTAFGSNLFKGKMNDDGTELNSDLVFASDDVKSWVKKHAEVLHDAQAGIDKIHYNGYTALSADKQTLYLFVEGIPTGPVAIKGLKNNIARIRIVGEGSMLGHQVFNKLYWSATPGIVYIDLPKDRLDKRMSVLAILLDKPIELHVEEVKAIENNL